MGNWVCIIMCEKDSLLLLLPLLMGVGASGRGGSSSRREGSWSVGCQHQTYAYVLRTDGGRLEIDNIQTTTQNTPKHLLCVISNKCICVCVYHHHHHQCECARLVRRVVYMTNKRAKN